MLSLHIREPPDTLFQIHNHEGSETHDTAKTTKSHYPLSPLSSQRLSLSPYIPSLRPLATQAMRCYAGVPTQITVLSGLPKSSPL